MGRRVLRRIAAVVVLLVSAGAFAVAQSETVYVTRTGAKYHRVTCGSLRSSSIPMPLSQAAARFGPCKNCNPPVPGAKSTVIAESAAAGTASPPPVKRALASGRCQATTKKGTQCSRNAKSGSSYCWQHGSVD